MFINSLEDVLNNEYNVSVTENGAIGYRTSGKNLLDLNFKVSSLRNAKEDEIISLFMKAFYDDNNLAIKWLFYARDVREGLGERRLFRAIVRHLALNNPDAIKHLFDYIPLYGRYDDVLCLIDTPHRDYVISMIKAQLLKDVEDKNDGKSISLLAKWMPSINTSSKETVRLAKIIRDGLGLTDVRYRKLLSELRRYIDVVEVKMSSKKWEDINYSEVPSRANLVYNGAFLRNDEARRREFLSSLANGETKINASVLFPHDIVHKYVNNKGLTKDDGIEALWKAMPDIATGCENTIVVADGSGSMRASVGGTEVSALEVANAIAIYFSERSVGEFKDKYITFSERPKLVNMSNCKSLHSKIKVALLHSEVADTNIESVFDLILTTAVDNNMSQSDIPKNVLIISDMEFNCCAVTKNNNRVDKRLFDVISNKYKEAGYLLPRLVFWNVCSRTGTIPVKENDCGVALVSGFSTNILKMVASNRTDPYELLVEQLMGERYSVITTNASS